jgi:ubiquitin-like 1-activating enzyme E1 B
MAGNIIPAIATTNAVIGGLIVVEALKVLDNRLEDCKTVSHNEITHYKKLWPFKHSIN